MINKLIESKLTKGGYKIKRRIFLSYNGCGVRMNRDFENRKGVQDDVCCEKTAYKNLVLNKNKGARRHLLEAFLPGIRNSHKRLELSPYPLPINISDNKAECKELRGVVLKRHNNKEGRK